MNEKKNQSLTRKIEDSIMNYNRRVAGSPGRRVAGSPGRRVAIWRPFQLANLPA